MSASSTWSRIASSMVSVPLAVTSVVWETFAQE
jgi:hypothetical protein